VVEPVETTGVASTCSATSVDMLSERLATNYNLKHINNMIKGYVYILICSNGKYYTGSTKNLEKRLNEHQMGEGANYTSKHLPVRLVYYEEFQRIDDAFYREKQIQGWSRKKKEALINGELNKLNAFAECKNETNYRNYREVKVK
jgi:putative endonuclease